MLKLKLKNKTPSNKKCMNKMHFKNSIQEISI
jgi:hypothetical protein